MSQIGNNNVFTGNSEDLVNVLTGRIEKPSIRGAIGVPYLTENNSVNAALTLDAGVDIWGNSASELTIGQTGALNVSFTYNIGPQQERQVPTGCFLMDIRGTAP